MSNSTDHPETRAATASAPAADPGADAGLKALGELPRDELEALAIEFGLEPRQFKTPLHLSAALHQRRQLIATLDREAMLDVVRWGRRPVPLNAGREQLAREIAQIRTMRFAGLSDRGLRALALLRGVTVGDGDDVPAITARLKKQEGLWARLGRKRRRLIGSIVSNILGEDHAADDYQFLPPQPGADPTAASASRPTSVKQEIEDAGLLGGLAGRIKRSADGYVNQKLDEIETRIDRKLDEIDRRLAEWRDREIANRIRILKITLWATVIVGAASILYSYIKVYLVGGG
jgi:hypothetical protein